VAADRYGLDRLKQMCEEELCKRVDAETVTTTLALADQHQCERLKKACVAFMASAEVMAAVVETRANPDNATVCSLPYLPAMANSSPISPEITSSRCITEHVTATLNFETTNYLQLKGMGVGKFVSSPIFRVGGYDWEIRFYPDGLNNDECEGKASCFLYYHNHAKDVSATFTLSMLETKGQKQICYRMLTDHVFSSGVEDWGYKRFVERSQLKSLSRLGDGCFTIRCVLTVRNESPPLELLGHLERMLKDGRGADVKFSIRGHEFRAHRSLLAARSPIFEAQLFDSMAEEDMQHVEVTDMEPTIFEMMLHYIYTDSLPPCSADGEGYKPAVMQHLLVAADKYGLGRLKQMCEEELCKRLDTETVMATLALANEHHCKRLKMTCLGFMSSTGVMAAVVETDGFKEHLKTCSQPLSLEEPRGERATTNQNKSKSQVEDLTGYVRT
jgi:speckle-type POZ protein